VYTEDDSNDNKLVVIFNQSPPAYFDMNYMP